ncbi:MAG: heavy metal translocating P-type ATPase [Cocleimonas sp.]|nr:heavy metal translocating P-type ATPase [Cocleimonas sp.]
MKECFHCGLPVPNGFDHSVTINNKPRAMCCIGCESVAKAIVENKLENFYNFRTDKSGKAEDLVPEELRQLNVYDDDELQKSFVRRESSESGEAIREASLILEGIVCAACVWLNEHHIKQLKGVVDFRINYSTHRASLKWNNNEIQLSEVLQEITNIGYHAHPFDPGRMETLQKEEKSKSLRRIAVAGIGMMQAMMAAIALYIGADSDMDANMVQLLRWMGLIITTPVVFYSARIFFISAWRDIKRRQLGMDVPVAIAIAAAYLASIWATVTQSGDVYFDSVAMFTFFLLVGRFLEMGARHKSGQVADELIRLTPVTATRIEENEHKLVSINELELGDKLLVKPGEVIPADGFVIEGQSSVNESLLTGESLPVSKKIKDALTGGTHNIESPLILQVDKLGDSTVLSSIVRLLERAQSEKPSLARFADRFAAWFVGIMLIISLSVFAFWWFNEPEKAFWVTLSVLVVTCPCALSLATPAALTTATGALTEKGVLTTRGHALETLAKVTHVFFDKTGTLTHGNLVVSDIQRLGNTPIEQCKQLAAGLETASEHPVAKALLKDIENTINVKQAKAESGKGIEGVFNNERYRIGTANYVSEIAGEKSVKETNEGQGGSYVYLGKQSQWLAKFKLEDEVREEAGQAISELKKMGIKVTLLSGDKQNVVDNIAETLGIQQAIGELLPEQKLQYLQKSQQQNEIVAMIGDGVNDAPVLAGAQVSIAMGEGSQLAQVSADMVLLSEKLTLLPEAIKTAREMQRIIKQNFAWAIFYNLLAIPLAATGMLAPWMAAIGMSFSSLVVVLNALRLK